MSKSPSSDRGANRIINRVVRAAGLGRRSTEWPWTITLPSGATRTVDLPLGSVMHLERHGLTIQPA